jgi:hypothetical protein
MLQGAESFGLNLMRSVEVPLCIMRWVWISKMDFELRNKLEGGSGKGLGVHAHRRARRIHTKSYVMIYDRGNGKY